MPIAGSTAEAYLRLRGLKRLPDRAQLLCVEDMPYYLTGDADRAEIIHRGPAMVAAIVGPAGRFAGIHLTYIDLAKPKGKVELRHPATGEVLNAKKSRGSKAGGHVVLTAPAFPEELVTGEGIETTAAVWLALAEAGRDLSRTAFWPALDLGNLAGAAAESVPHPELKDRGGRPRRFPGPLPDLARPALAIPDSVTRLVLLGDGDSEPFMTRCALARAGVRYAREGRSTVAAWAPDGQDFGDLIRDPERIVAIVDEAAPLVAPEILPTKKARKNAVQDQFVRTQAPPEATDGAPESEIHFDPPKPPKSKTALDRDCAFFPLTDMGNAERFVARNKGKFLWCNVIGWLAWDGKRYVRTGAGGLVESAVFETIRAIQDEADAIEASGIRVEGGSGLDFVVDPDKEIKWSDQIRSWGRTSEGNSHFTCIARGDKPGMAGSFLAVAHEQLDADPMKLNVSNGTLVFRSNESPSIVFKPHDPADRITKICPVDYDPKATCPTYDAFFTYVQPDPRMRRFLHQWGGYSLTGDASEQKMLFWYGEGKNGKSTTLELWGYVAGDYATATKIATFLDSGKMQNAAQATPHLAKLRGIRMLRTSEPPPRGARLDEGLIKLVTGGDTIDARHMYREDFTFLPEFKVNMAGNHRPVIAGADEGIWRRFRLAPWLVTVPEDMRDRRLPEKLRAEGSGVLNRLLDGLRDWLENGLIEPDAVTEATARYRSESDPLSRFLEHCVRRASGKRVNTTDLYVVFLAWAKSSGESEWTHKGFSRAMHDRGFITVQSNKMFWIDIELIKSAADFAYVAPAPSDGMPPGMDEIAL